MAVKGQVFRFEGYEKCQTAIAMLTGQFERMQAFATVIGSPTWNWEHPKVLKSLKDVIAINSEDIHKSLTDNNVAVFEIVSETYKRIYG